MKITDVEKEYLNKAVEAWEAKSPLERFFHDRHMRPVVGLIRGIIRTGAQSTQSFLGYPLVEAFYKKMHSYFLRSNTDELSDFNKKTLYLDQIDGLMPKQSGSNLSLSSFLYDWIITLEKSISSQSEVTEKHVLFTKGVFSRTPA